ncbi:hypothetical protein DPEC_G00331550 [Dallia pectoralis]|uniref:Uncharacterized protein n=1 Tax=Dallia pectoralis TaxID=75939 RepID=A0ACC2F5T7_DALPE|nr:hypothetical protein DPEC_G00331550 [Dallia pectoralis]
MPPGKEEAPALAGVDWASEGETELEVDRASAQKIPDGQVVSSTKIPDWRGNEFLHWMNLDVQGFGCPAVKDSRIRRHHKLCDLLAEEAESVGWHVTKEMVCRTPSGAQRRPDLVFVRGGEALVVDVTVQFEMAQETLQLAAARKWQGKDQCCHM